MVVGENLNILRLFGRQHWHIMNISEFSFSWTEMRVLVQGE